MKRSVEWIPEAASENPSTEFRFNAEGLDIGKGTYFTGFGDCERAVTGKEFEDHCSAINWQRRWNTATMTRNGKQCTVRRKRSAPACEDFVVNFSPAQMRFINKEMELWNAAGIPAEERKEMILALVNEIRRDVLDEFKKVSGRDVAASYIHWDSNKIHIGIVHSRVGPDNMLVGVKKLGTVGPWSVAQSRLATLGLVDSGDHRLRDNLERFHTRFGQDREPLDVRLHSLLDQRFESMLPKMSEGAERRYDDAEEYYKSWKSKARHDSVTRSPGSQRIAWETVRLVTPLLPPQVRAALSIARTATQVFSVLGTALNAISMTSSPQAERQLEKTKTI